MALALSSFRLLDISDIASRRSGSPSSDCMNSIVSAISPSASSTLSVTHMASLRVSSTSACLSSSVPLQSLSCLHVSSNNLWATL